MLPFGKGSAMTATADEYLENAKACLKWADMTKSPADREHFLDLAQTWTMAAVHAGLEVPSPNAKPRGADARPRAR
jgi:hypothetical protein